MFHNTVWYISMNQTQVYIHPRTLGPPSLSRTPRLEVIPEHSAELLVLYKQLPISYFTRGRAFVSMGLS